MVSKKDIINFLFVVSFPVYGIGAYVSASLSPSAGYIFSAAPFIAIVFFYIVDLLYRTSFNIRVNGRYLLMVLFLCSSVVALFISLFKNMPETNTGLTITRSMLILIPFQAFVVVHLYNDSHKPLVRLTFISLSLLLFTNIIGFFVLGISNEGHSIEGRINFPFLNGLYSGAALLAILNLMLLYYFRYAYKNPFLLAGWVGYFILNMTLLFYINSRLTMLVFLLVAMLLMLNVIRFTGIFWITLFTIPILLSTGMILFQILSLPFFASMLQRIELVDIVTFNGRAFLWRDGMDWLLFDHRGLVFGNGYRGHYFLNLISDVAELWNEKNEHHLHLHSTSLEILVGQGLVGFIIFLLLFFKLFTYFRDQFKNRATGAVLFPVVVFLLIILQIDGFVYMESLGALIFAWLFSFTVLNPSSKTAQTASGND